MPRMLKPEVWKQPQNIEGRHERLCVDRDDTEAQRLDRLRSGRYKEKR